jgi:hypothetical protein
MGSHEQGANRSAELTTKPATAKTMRFCLWECGAVSALRNHVKREPSAKMDFEKEHSAESGLSTSQEHDHE